MRSSTNLEKLLSAVILGVGLILVGASFTVACSSSPSGVDTKDAGTTAKSDAAARDAGTSADVVIDVGPGHHAFESAFLTDAGFLTLIDWIDAGAPPAPEGGAYE